MSLVTVKQQEIIDNVVSSYIKTHDAIAQQYLKLRQDILEMSTKVGNEIQENGAVKPELLLRLQELTLENDKLSLTYGAHVARIASNLEFSEHSKPQYLEGLESQNAELATKQKLIDADLEQLRESNKPVVDKMKVLASKYETGVTVKIGGKAKPLVKTQTSKGSVSDPESTFIDYESSVFEKSELAALFGDVETKLRQLKTVDEINDATDPSEKGKSDQQPINIVKYLDELLQNSRAYSHLDETKYSYDIARSSSIDVGSAALSLDDYDHSIQVLTSDIKELVARGAEAKERWLTNARKVELLQAVLQSTEDDMDIEE